MVFYDEVCEESSAVFPAQEDPEDSVHGVLYDEDPEDSVHGCLYDADQENSVHGLYDEYQENCLWLSL